MEKLPFGVWALMFGVSGGFGFGIGLRQLGTCCSLLIIGHGFHDLGRCGMETVMVRDKGLRV